MERPIVCLQRDHQCDPILYVCVAPKCSNEHRLLCQRCLQQEHTRTHFEYLLLLQDVLCADGSTDGNADANKIHNWPPNSQSVKEMRDFVRASDEANSSALLQDVEKVFDDLITSVTDQILHLKKQVVTRLLAARAQNADVRQRIVTQMRAIFDLTPLKDALAQYTPADCGTDAQKRLFEKLDAFCCNEDRQSALTDLRKYFVRTRQDSVHLDVAKMSKLQAEIAHAVQTAQTRWGKKEMALDFVGSAVRDSNLHVWYEDQVLTISEDKYVYSSAFKRHKHITLTFQLLELNGSQSLYVGVGADRHKNCTFFLESGNQIELASVSAARQVEIVGELTNRSCIQNNAVFTIEVCVAQSQLEIYNDDRTYHVRNAHPFDNDEDEEWRIMIYNHPMKRMIKILECLIE